MTVEMRRLFVVVVVVLPLLGTLVDAACPPVCVHGACTDGESCTCLPEFDGADCTIPIKRCPDGKRVCYNGADCVRNNERDPVTKKYRYHCDCSKAYGVSAFAGLQCEHSHTQSCVESRISEYTFCTNGGECQKIVNNGEKHAGCICASGFTGSHCQYLEGEEPPDELKEELGTVESVPDPISGGAIAFIVVISFFGTVAFSVFAWKMQKQRNDLNAQMPEAPHADVQMEVTGTETSPPESSPPTSTEDKEVI